MFLRQWTLKSRSSLLLCVITLLSFEPASALQQSNHALRKRQNTNVSTLPLEDFQVYEPVLTPSGTSDRYGCIHTQLLMEHVFAYSYGHPFFGMISITNAEYECD